MTDTTTHPIISTSTGQRIQSAVVQAIKGAGPRLLAYREDLRLYIPEPFIQAWSDFLTRELAYGVNPEIIEDKKVIKYAGIPVVPGYELKVILAHKDSSLFNGQDRYMSVIKL